MNLLLLTHSLVFLFYSGYCQANSDHSGLTDLTWTCKNNACKHLSSGEEGQEVMTWETCIMLCRPSPPIWPRPKSVNIVGKSSTAFFKERIILKTLAPESLKTTIERAANIFLDNLEDPGYRLVDDNEQIVKLNVHVRSDADKLTLATDESYSLLVQRFEGYVLINVYAESFFGARHGLETLSQLIWLDAKSKSLRILHDIKIDDAPAFRHRGVMIDTARNFFPMHLIKKAVDGMSFTKLNGLHLHLTDVESFPIALPHHPEFAQRGAYGTNMTYSPDDIRDLIDYARVRGVRVILEIDAPSHVQNGWPEGMTMCGQINPDEPKAFDTIEGFYRDLYELGTDPEMFHVGGDEVNLKCWKDTKAARGLPDLGHLWVNTTFKVLDRLKAAGNGTLPENVIIWSSHLTDKYLDVFSGVKNLVVQYWYGKFEPILALNRKVIFSTVGQWYLDCGFGPWKLHQKEGSCNPYTSWQKFYNYRPWSRFKDKLDLVIGGEVCLWSEQVSPDAMETRLWPRSAAFAERVWRDPENMDEVDVFARISIFSLRLERKGIGVAAIWPMRCTMNPGECYK